MGLLSRQLHYERLFLEIKEEVRRIMRKIIAQRGSGVKEKSEIFASRPINEAYLWLGARYVDLNPVRAGLVNRAVVRWAALNLEIKPEGS